jgi:hypothetical protein
VDSFLKIENSPQALALSLCSSDGRELERNPSQYSHQRTLACYNVAPIQPVSPAVMKAEKTRKQRLRGSAEGRDRHR